jgi:hypothetical protein
MPFWSHRSSIARLRRLLAASEFVCDWLGDVLVAPVVIFSCFCWRICSVHGGYLCPRGSINSRDFYSDLAALLVGF